MAKDPFAEFNAEPVAKPPSSSTSAGANVLMRVVSGVALVALLGLALGYYLPLRRAHTLLNDKYEAKNTEIGGLADQLKKTTDQLVATQSERDSLKEAAEKREQADKKKDDSVEKITSDLEKALSRFVKTKQVSVETRGAASVVTIDDKQLFGKRDTSPTRQGKKLLCAVGKALETVSVKHDVTVGGHTSSNKVSDPIVRRDFPSVWQLSAMRAAGAVSALESCGVPGDHMRAVGYANTRPDEGSAKGSTGEIRLSVEPSK
jgi:flagellar motor protein MotB